MSKMLLAVKIQARLVHGPSSYCFALLSPLLLSLLVLRALGAPYRSGRPFGANPAGAARMDARRFSKGQGRPFEKFP
ncbi:hypothetical protein, partial [Xanthomonas sp. LMC-A-07]|uniref:hypothetical protein n=1 Tax=Xanthomonas sp. LMC-A-07 TaxID=3040329 RepID=UPI00255330C5